MNTGQGSQPEASRLVGVAVGIQGRDDTGGCFLVITTHRNSKQHPKSPANFLLPARGQVSVFHASGASRKRFPAQVRAGGMCFSCSAPADPQNSTPGRSQTTVEGRIMGQGREDRMRGRERGTAPPTISHQAKLQQGLGTRSQESWGGQATGV